MQNLYCHAPFLGVKNPKREPTDCAPHMLIGVHAMGILCLNHPGAFLFLVRLMDVRTHGVQKGTAKLIGRDGNEAPRSMRLVAWKCPGLAHVWLKDVVDAVLLGVIVERITRN